MPVEPSVKKTNSVPCYLMDVKRTNHFIIENDIKINLHSDTSLLSSNVLHVLSNFIKYPLTCLVNLTISYGIRFEYAASNKCPAHSCQMAKWCINPGSTFLDIQP